MDPNPKPQPPDFTKIWKAFSKLPIPKNDKSPKSLPVHRHQKFWKRFLNPNKNKDFYPATASVVCQREPCQAGGFSFDPMILVKSELQKLGVYDEKFVGRFFSLFKLMKDKEELDYLKQLFIDKGYEVPEIMMHVGETVEEMGNPADLRISQADTQESSPLSECFKPEDSTHLFHENVSFDVEQYEQEKQNFFEKASYFDLPSTQEEYFEEIKEKISN